VPIGAPAMTTVAKGLATPAAVPTRAPVMVPRAMLAGAPMVAATAKGSAVPAAGPAGVLVLASKKGRPPGGWSRAVTVAPTAVPAGAPVATTAPTLRS
jgi:hypothetical protein